MFDSLSKDQRLRDLLYPSKKMIEAKEASMNDIIRIEDKHYYFIGNC